MSKNAYFTSVFERQFFGSIILVWVCIFQYFKGVAALCSYLQCFHDKSYYSFLCSTIWKCLSSLWLVLRFFSLSLVLNSLIVLCLGIIFLLFLVLGVYWDSWICAFMLFKCLSGLPWGTLVIYVLEDFKLSHFLFVFLGYVFVFHFV